MERHRTLRLTIERADDMPGELWQGLDGHPFDDNGGEPDGNAWLPATPLNASDAGVQAILDEDYGEMVDAMYFDGSRDVIDYAHDLDDPAAAPTAAWLETTDPEEVAETAWDMAQELGGWFVRYGNGDVIVVGNPFPVV